MSRPHIIIVGAGPAGLLAAWQAAEQGARVTVLEHKPRPGLKLLITGKGRCNLSNTNELKDFIGAFGKAGRFLYGSFSQFFREDLLALLASQGVETVSERGGRIFPSSQKSQDILSALLGLAARDEIDILYGQNVTDLVMSSDRGVTGVRTDDRLMKADAVILATGGLSYPSTGSDGSGYKLARQAGHSIVKPLPALTAMIASDSWPLELQGLTLKNVKVDLDVDDRTLNSRFGELLFTHFGISGPTVYDLSRSLVHQLRDQLEPEAKQVLIPTQLDATISIDLKPALSTEQLKARLQRDFDTGGKRYLTTIVKQLLPSKMIPVFLRLCGLSRTLLGSQINHQQKDNMVDLLKRLKIRVKALSSWDQAVITAGGVELTEVEPRSLRSKLVSNLYFAGEILDLDAPTGGYNLQESFSTGWAAGHWATKNLRI